MFGWLDVPLSLTDNARLGQTYLENLEDKIR